MPSALRASRSFASNALARVRAGLGAYERDLDRQGPEIKVEPFDAANVSTPAALVKLGTSIAAARRHKANFQAAQQDAELAREKTRAEIAHLRAEAEYNLGTGRQNAGRAAPVTLTKGPYAGMTAAEASTVIQDKGQKARAANHADAMKARSHLAQANAGMKQLDASVERAAKAGALLDMGTYEPHFRNAARTPRPDTTDQVVLDKSLGYLGINPGVFNAPSTVAGNPTASDKAKMLSDARTRIFNALLQKHRIAANAQYQPQRDRYQQVIDQGIPPVDEGDQGGETAVQGDPLDAFYGQ